MENRILDNPKRFSIPIQPPRPTIESTVANTNNSQVPLAHDEISHLRGIIQGNKLSSTAKWIAIVAALAALIGAVAALYGNAILSKQKERLESQVAKLETQKNSLEGEITTRKEELSRLTESAEDQRIKIDKLQKDKGKAEESFVNLEKDIANQKYIVNKLQSDRRSSQTEINNLTSKKKLLEDQNSVLIEKNFQLENNIKESLLQAFVDTVHSYHNSLEESPAIEMQIDIPGDIGGTVLGIAYSSLNYVFDKNSWDVVINRVKYSFDMVSSVKIQQGKKREMIKIKALTFNLEEVIKRSVERISKWSSLSDKFAQDLSSKIDTYIQKYPEEFQIPLGFRFTGMSMTFNEANEEIRRLYSLFHTPIAAASYVLESKVNAAAFKLFKFLGYNEPDDMKKPWGVSR